MRLRKPLAAIAAAAITATIGLVAAPAASAAPISVVVTEVSGALSAAPTSVTGTGFVVDNQTTAALTVVSAGVTLVNGTACGIGNTACVVQAANAVEFKITQTASVLLDSATFTDATINVTYTGGGGGSSSAPASAPADFILALGADENGVGGAVCAEGTNLTGLTGQWMILPGQGDCTLPSKPGAKLLGWSTSASFPVAIAQRQADNDWGTYVVYDEAGDIVAVYIPAGHGTFVTGANTLHPIWSN